MDALPIIDAHHHLWRYDAREYGWIDGPLAALRRDFLLPELARARTEGGVSATIAVQARQSVTETRWLLGLAAQEPAIVGVVGWLPIASPRLEAELDGIRGPLVDLRHVVQGEAAGFLDDPAFDRGLEALARRDLAYDLLIRDWQLPEAVRCVARHPRLRFILDHGAKPDLRPGGDLTAWEAGIRDLARHPQVWCKLSGLVTEADWATWDLATIRRAFDVLLDAFGPQRLLFGSDWPVCLAASGYARWLGTVRTLIADLPLGDRAAILAGNAATAYRLRSPA